MFTSFKRGGVTHSSSLTLALTQKASTQQSLKTFMESLNALLSSTCKNPELPSLLTCKKSHSYGKHLCEPWCHLKEFKNLKKKESALEQRKSLKRSKGVCQKLNKPINPSLCVFRFLKYQSLLPSFLQGEVGENAIDS